MKFYILTLLLTLSITNLNYASEQRATDDLEGLLAAYASGQTINPNRNERYTFLHRLAQLQAQSSNSSPSSSSSSQRQPVIITPQTITTRGEQSSGPIRRERAPASRHQPYAAYYQAPPAYAHAARTPLEQTTVSRPRVFPEYRPGGTRTVSQLLSNPLPPSNAGRLSQILLITTNLDFSQLTHTGINRLSEHDLRASTLNITATGGLQALSDEQINLLAASFRALQELNFVDVVILPTSYVKLKQSLPRLQTINQKLNFRAD